MTGSYWTRGRLPSRVALGSEEALDSYLERLAFANELRSTQLMRLLTAAEGCSAPSSNFLVVKPDLAIIERIAALGGLEVRSLVAATLMRYDDGIPLRLERLDPRERHSFRQVVAQGWFPPFGSQACPQCLVRDGVWELAWRLPIVAVCAKHGAFLTSRCDGCGRRFRTRRISPLRPELGREQLCGNPIGLRNPCRHPVVDHVPEAVPASIISSAIAVRRALSGRPIVMLGRSTTASTYLAELRHMATLLLHLLSRPRGSAFADWASGLVDEAAERTAQERTPRWGFSPPHSAVVRGSVLAEAHAILNQSDVAWAAMRLRPWLSLIADVTNGPSAWLVNRTTRTATMEQVIRAACADRHHVGRRLDQGTRTAFPPSAVPQLIDKDTYRDMFAAMLGVRDDTGRMYVSLCLLRAIESLTSWATAAETLGLDRDVGVRVARAASHRMCASPEQFTAAVRRTLNVLPRTRDFRGRESRVRALASFPEWWFDAWRTSMSPARRTTSLPHVITWMWCEVAQGSLGLTPGWPQPPTTTQQARYRQFRESLPFPAQGRLRAIVVEDSQINCTN
ncbi:TniQ family protein [Mycobacterium marseillense]|uniref:TniQ family protein n=1 Tax=Mycobacterium marseillense TaxID=701042 RepID=UPI0011A9399D|nr:TniQ family protein [Mycobacterium marseillense]